jgi:DmsE family decaheme c-type cytochrome
MKYAAASLSILTLLGAAIAQTTEPTSPPAASGPGFDVAECQGCHADVLFTNFQHSQHAKKVAGSCAACHGDVATHARMKMEGEEGLGPIISFKRLTPQQTNQACLSCHDQGRQANWHGGAHDRRNVSCTSCHSVHFFRSQRGQLRAARDTEVCYGCHQQVRAQSLRQSHHPVREGKMDCGSCHDPHSSSPQKGMLKAESVNDLCYTCHADKRGPWLWEHPPVRENCTLCHTPHGSNHERLLVAKQPWLCQRCHMATRHPGTLYHGANSVVGGTANPSNRAVEHGCRNCHNQIHGSNHPGSPYLGR